MSRRCRYVYYNDPNNFGNYSISDDGLTVNGGSSVFYVESSKVLNKTLYFECVLNWTSFGSHYFGFTIGDHEIYNILNYKYIRGSSVVFGIDTYGRIMGITFFYENGPYKDYNFPYIDFTSTDVVSFGVNKEYADFYKNGVLVLKLQQWMLSNLILIIKIYMHLKLANGLLLVLALLIDLKILHILNWLINITLSIIID